MRQVVGGSWAVQGVRVIRGDHRHTRRKPVGLRLIIVDALDGPCLRPVGEHHVKAAPQGCTHFGQRIRRLSGRRLFECEQRQFAPAAVADGGSQRAASVQHRRDHAIPVDRHPGAAGCAVTSANDPRTAGPPGALWIPRAIDAFVTIGGKQDPIRTDETNNCAHGRQHGLGRYDARRPQPIPNRRRLAHREQAARRLHSITDSYGRHPKYHPTAKDAASRGT